MCGIVFAAGDITGSHEKAIRTMLVLDSLRGEDSTGLFSAAKNFEDDYILAKQVGNPFELFDTSNFKKIYARQNRVMIGHNRYATQGKVNKVNAHPYDFDTLCGVHNGTLTNKWQMHEANKFDVDSQALYHHIEQKGLEDAMMTARGAWALVWWNKVLGTLNVIRNSERTLYWATTEDSKVILGASETWMIVVAAQKHGIKIQDPIPFQEGFLHTIPVRLGGKIDQVKVREVQMLPKAQNVGVVVQGGSGNVHRGNFQQQQQRTTSTAIVEVKKGTDQKFDGRSVFDSEFVGRRNVELEAVCLKSDQFGAEYVICFCPDKPFYEIRLYAHGAAKQVADNIGCEFTGSISQFLQTDSGRVGYYKVSPHSVNITAIDPNGTGEQPLLEYKDQRGNLISKKAWEDRYGTCSYCTDSIQAEDTYLGAGCTAMGNSFCASCAALDEVRNFAHII